jgi:hypothetical protein
MTVSGGSYGTYISHLRSDGLIHGGSERRIITDAGREIVGDVRPLSAQELMDRWAPKIGTGGRRRILDVLIEARGAEVPLPELAERAEMTLDGGSFGTYLSHLVTFGLVTRSRGTASASAQLFE